MWVAVVAAASAFLVALAGGLATKIGPWYKELKKPSFQPPDWLFGPAWTLIFGLAAYSGYLAWYGAETPTGKAVVIALFAVNGVLNILWSVLFFTLQRPDWSLIEVVPLWLSCLALIVGLWPFSVTAALLIVPYLLWVSFASLLNRAIVRLNGPFGTAEAIRSS